MNINKYLDQDQLFAAQPSRMALQNIFNKRSESLSTLTVNVWRNHAFESVVSLAGAYEDYGNYSVKYRLSDYDNTLSFNNHQAADINLLWIDSSYYLNSLNFEDWLEWLNLRVLSLRAASNTPIIVATWTGDKSNSEKLKEVLESIPSVYFADIEHACNEAGVVMLSQRTAAIAGTQISGLAQAILARKLACHWLPATVFPPIKAVALDLDNTLHAGALGEDGVDGVKLTSSHELLQIYIKSLQKKGIFIALVSRNEEGDVRELFMARKDYPLQWDDFSATEVSWGAKSDALVKIANYLNISLDSILFVDDNPGELSDVTSDHPEVHSIYATIDALQTRRVLEYYPGLWRWRVDPDDEKRIKDMKANSERVALLNDAEVPNDYFKSLESKLIFRYNPVAQLDRLAALCGKTNQFNLAMKRFTQAELSEIMMKSNSCVISVQMLDRLSDSGVIAVIVAESKSDQLVIRELCISCRAMGRNLEDVIILESLRQAPIFNDALDSILWEVKIGPRNQPAVNWLMEKNDAQKIIEEGGCLSSIRLVSDYIPPSGILLIKE